MAGRFGIALVLVVISILFLASPASADGIIIPDPCKPGACPVPPAPCPVGKSCPPVHPITVLNIKSHHVTVKIDQQVAVTHVDQVFFNPNTWTVEGTYLFPLPAGAAISKFTLWVDGKPVDGKVLDAQEARRVYEEIIRQHKDPAMLEYTGRGAVQARLYPILPRGERRIELEYTQVLPADSGLVRYSYPLNTEKFSSTPLESVSISVDVRSPQPIRAIYSPSHAVAVHRSSDTQATVSWEANQVKPNQDFNLYYSIGEAEAFHLITYRNPGDPQDPDGFFLLLLAPRPAEPEKPVAKDVILVLDRSGSMEGEKFRQAQAALKYILQHLNSDDRFGLLTFSTSVEPYVRGLRPASEAAQAAAWVDRLSAQGSTDINRALLEASSIADKERPTYLIFLTDGLPTVGETKSNRITENFSSAVSKNVRLFAFGVGYDVDTVLLDTLSQQQHGLSTYVKPGEKLDEVLSSFYERISTPVLTDLSLDFGKIVVYDLYPSPLPDLFAGSQVIVMGRYREGGKQDVILKGVINGQTQTLRFASQIFVDDSRGMEAALTGLPRLWATRKIGYLLNQVRLKGADQETINQIVKLSIRYGIVTPYTSYLVTEPMPLGAENQQRVAQDAYRQYQSSPQAASGQGAVQKAAEQGALSQAQQAPDLPAGSGQTVLSIGSKTFVFSNGTWIDTAYDPKKMVTMRVPFLSTAYFQLAQSRPEAAAWLALGEKVIVVVDQTVYEIVSEDSIQPVVTIPPAQTPFPFTPTSKPSSTASIPATPQVTTPTQPESNSNLGFVLMAAIILAGISLVLYMGRKK